MAPSRFIAGADHLLRLRQGKGSAWRAPVLPFFLPEYEALPTGLSICIRSCCGGESSSAPETLHFRRGYRCRPASPGPGSRALQGALVCRVPLGTPPSPGAPATEPVRAEILPFADPSFCGARWEANTGSRFPLARTMLVLIRLRAQKPRVPYPPTNMRAVVDEMIMLFDGGAYLQSVGGVGAFRPSVFSGVWRNYEF